MPKKRKNRRHKKLRVHPPGNVPPSLLSLPVIAGPTDSRKAQAYLQKVQAYEDWVLARRPQDRWSQTAERIPEEYLQLMRLWPDGFEFYRDSLAIYLERVLGLWPWHSHISSLLRRAEHLDADATAAFYAVANEASGRYTSQSNNAFSSLHDTLDLTSPTSRIRAILHSYCSIYEVDFILWFVGCLARSATTDRLDPDWFGGPHSGTTQAALVSQIADALAGSPLQEAFNGAFWPELRNAVSHNDYDILTDNTGRPHRVRRITTGKEWTIDEIERVVSAAYHMANRIHAAAAHGTQRWEARQSDQLEKFGIVDTVFADSHGDHVTAFLMQLWCFYDLDPLGTWVDRATAIVEPGDDGHQHMTLGMGGICGPQMPTELSDRLSSGWIEVIRIAIAPDLDVGHPSYNAHGRCFEVLGVPDRHIIPVKIRRP